MGNPCIQEAAKFAIEDQNWRQIPQLELVGGEKAAHQSLSGSGVIYFLVLKANCNGGNHMLFNTAVREEHFMESIGLWCTFYERETLGLPHVVDPEIKAAAEFSVEHHNRKNHTQLKLVAVVGHVVLGTDGYREYGLTILTQDQREGDQLRLFSTVVSKGIWDNFMESTGLLYLSKAQLQPPNDMPDWITSGLLTKKSSLSGDPNYWLINLMKNEYSLRRRIPDVALSLGEEGTKELSIPYLIQNTVGVDSRVLLVLAEQLGLLLPYVGGVEYAPVMPFHL
ncbi:hypothetical protein IFM89_034496 [Coptis chinensis]|uniref:Uncharacterized protein n=1 Tax=Coptis chinensis TaxID=261450 RepID=A0A835HTW8_9MAGN|nr:hypothetical protein IFM89_034496 [Coptis chinensis]